MDDNKTKVGVFLCEDNLISCSLISELLAEKEKELGITIVGLEDDIKGHDYDAVILDEFEDYVGKLSKPIKYYEIDSMSLLTCKDEVEKLEPLWVRQQQNKKLWRK